MTDKYMNYYEGFTRVTKMKMTVHVTKSITAQPNKISPFFCRTWTGSRQIHSWSKGLLLLLNLCHLPLLVCLPNPKLFIADIICRGNGVLKHRRIVRGRKKVIVTYSKIGSAPWNVYQTQKAIHWPFFGIKFLQQYGVVIWTLTKLLSHWLLDDRNYVLYCWYTGEVFFKKYLKLFSIYCRCPVWQLFFPWCIVRVSSSASGVVRLLTPYIQSNDFQDTDLSTKWVNQLVQPSSTTVVGM